MKIPEGSIPKSLYTENPESIEGAKTEKAWHQISPEIETTKHIAPPDSSNASAKKAELAMSGQAAAIKWKAMGDGSVKDMQRDINEYRHQRGMPPIKEDGIYGPETERAARNVQEDQVDLERIQSDASKIQTRTGQTAEEQMMEALSKPDKGDPFEVKLAEEIKKKFKQL
jgi:peptidoglycan hydrolase-like protein with peptidoglycan-binding domain